MSAQRIPDFFSEWIHPSLEFEVDKDDQILEVKGVKKNRIITMLAAACIAMAGWNFFFGKTIPVFPLLVALCTVLLTFLREGGLAKFAYFALLLSPIVTALSGEFLCTAAVLILTCHHSFLITKSAKYTLFHLCFNVLLLQFFCTPVGCAKIKAMSSEAMAEAFDDSLDLVCFSAVTYGITLYFEELTHNRLINKLFTFKQNLDQANKTLNDEKTELSKNIQMKDTFIYSFSHELKNALNGLLGNLFLALEEVKDDKTLGFLTNARVCGEVLKNFIHNVLDSGKLENGNLEVTFERANVRALLENTWAVCGQIIRNKRLHGFMRIAKDIPEHLELDQQRIMQIMLNLTSNASKFTDEGKIHYDISWSLPGNNSQASPDIDLNEETESEENFHQSKTFEKADKMLPCGSPTKKFMETEFYELNFQKFKFSARENLYSDLPPGTQGVLKIQIFDTGCGMSPEDQKKLFKKFSQVGKNDAHKKIGTGLGLWICKELAERLNGEIKVHSIPDVGSSFQVLIRTSVSPIGQKSADSVSPHLNHSGSSTFHSSKGNFRTLRSNSRFRNLLSSSIDIGQIPKKLVLIVDDDCFSLELMKNYMKKLGIEYLCGYNGEDAVKIYEENHDKICLIFTDNQMPKKTGTEAAKEIRTINKQIKRRYLPIFCTSGDPIKFSENKGPFTGFLSKPIEFQNIQNILRNYNILE
mgnify:FL=1